MNTFFRGDSYIMKFYVCSLGVAPMLTAFTLSTMSSQSLEDVSKAAPGLLKFFQVYVFKDREVIIYFKFKLCIEYVYTFTLQYKIIQCKNIVQPQKFSLYRHV